MNNFFGSLTITLVVLAIVGLISLFVYAGLNRQAWLDAHCEIIGKVSGSTGIGPTVSSSGKVGVGTVFISGKTGYKCDDGMEYWE